MGVGTKRTIFLRKQNCVGDELCSAFGSEWIQEAQHEHPACCLSFCSHPPSVSHTLIQACAVMSLPPSSIPPSPYADSRIHAVSCSRAERHAPPPAERRADPPPAERSAFCRRRRAPRHGSRRARFRAAECGIFIATPRAVFSTEHALRRAVASTALETSAPRQLLLPIPRFPR